MPLVSTMTQAGREQMAPSMGASKRAVESGRAEAVQRLRKSKARHPALCRSGIAPKRLWKRPRLGVASPSWDEMAAPPGHALGLLSTAAASVAWPCPAVTKKVAGGDGEATAPCDVTVLLLGELRRYGASPQPGALAWRYRLCLLNTLSGSPSARLYRPRLLTRRCLPACSLLLEAALQVGLNSLVSRDGGLPTRNCDLLQPTTRRG